VTFTPTTTGDRPGTLTVGTSTPITLDGTGIDFTIAVSPTSGSVVAGLGTSTSTTVTPLAGFANQLLLTCTTNAPAASCIVSSSTLTPVSAASATVQINTVSEYTVIGYQGGVWWFAGLATGGLLWWRRRALRASGRWTRAALTLVLFALTALGAGLSTLGCSGEYPAKHSSYTPDGNYSVTVTATDGFLSHSAAFALKVTD
jgi:hypothetical protein